MEEIKVTKSYLEQLIAAGEAWEGKVDRKITIDPLTIRPTDSLMPVIIPDIPEPFLAVSRQLVKTHEKGTFPNLERVIADAGDPWMGDVLQDLRRAARML